MISAYSIRDQCPFSGVFDPAFTVHGGELNQLVDAGENGVGEVVSRFGIFESNKVSVVFQIFECFSSHSARIPGPAPRAYRRYLIFGGEFALIGFFYC